MKKFALALASGALSVTLLATFYLPVMKQSLLGHPGFVRAWQTEGRPIYELGIAGEVAVGLFVAAVVYAAFGHRRDAARWGE